MRTADWIALGVLLVATVGPVLGWLLQHVLRDTALQSEHGARISRVEQDAANFYNQRIDKLLSDLYGTIANNSAALEKRLDRLERKVFNGHKDEP